MMFDSFQYAIFASIHGGHSVTNKLCLQNTFFHKFILIFTFNKNCYKMLYEIIVSTTVKPEEIKTVQMSLKGLKKTILLIQRFYFLSLCCFI